MVVTWWRFVINVTFGFSKIGRFLKCHFLGFFRRTISPMNISRPFPLPHNLQDPFLRLFQTWKFFCLSRSALCSQQRISWDRWNLHNRISVVFDFFHVWRFFSLHSLVVRLYNRIMRSYWPCFFVWTYEERMPIGPLTKHVKLVEFKTWEEENTSRGNHRPFRCKVLLTK